LTRMFAAKYNKPWLHVNLNDVKDPVTLIKNWIFNRKIRILNVAGKVESKTPGIYNHVKEIIIKVLKVDTI